MWPGNSRADHLASERAALIFDQDVARAQAWLDDRVWKVHERLLDAVEWWVLRPDFAPPRTHSCRPPTKQQWFSQLLGLPAQSRHRWHVHKKGLICKSCGLKLAAHQPWEILKPAAASACDGNRYLEAASYVHPTHLLEGSDNGVLVCRLCKCRAQLYRLSATKLIANCKKYRKTS